MKLKFYVGYCVYCNVNNAGDNIEVRLSMMVRYKEQLTRTVRAIVANPQDAEDVVQDTFVKALSALSSYDAEKSSLATWLSRIAYRTALNYVRDYRRHVRLDRIDVPDLDGESNEDAEVLMRAIDLLPADERAMLSMYYYQDMRLSDISYITGLNVKTLATRMFRVRKRLATIIETLVNE